MQTNEAVNLYITLVLMK